MLETFDEQHFIDVNKGGWLSARGGGGDLWSDFYYIYETYSILCRLKYPYVLNERVHR